MKLNIVVLFGPQQPFAYRTTHLPAIIPCYAASPNNLTIIHNWPYIQIPQITTKKPSLASARMSSQYSPVRAENKSGVNQNTTASQKSPPAAEKQPADKNKQRDINHRHQNKADRRTVQHFFPISVLLIQINAAGRLLLQVYYIFWPSAQNKSPKRPRMRPASSNCPIVKIFCNSPRSNHSPCCRGQRSINSGLSSP